jgi:hypothetical protein
MTNGTGFAKILAQYRLCHPEAKPKDLAAEQEVLLVRSPDPSLRCATFRMTTGAQASMMIRMTHDSR